MQAHSQRFYMGRVITFCGSGLRGGACSPRTQLPLAIGKNPANWCNVCGSNLGKLELTPQTTPPPPYYMSMGLMQYKTEWKALTCQAAINTTEMVSVVKSYIVASNFAYLAYIFLITGYYPLKGRWPRFQARAPPISFLTIEGRAAASPPPSI